MQLATTSLIYHLKNYFFLSHSFFIIIIFYNFIHSTGVQNFTKKKIINSKRKKNPINLTIERDLQAHTCL